MWNQVFAGTVGAPSEAGFPDPAVHDPRHAPRSAARSRSCHIGDDGAWRVRVPDAPHRLARHHAGPTAPTAGRDLPLSAFHVATPGRVGQAMRPTQLDRGKNLLLTPGVYDVDRSLVESRRDDTVVLGLGQATLTAVGGATPVVVRRPGRGRRPRRRHRRRRHRELSRDLMHIGRRQPGGDAEPRTRHRPARPSTTSTSASAVRTSASADVVAARSTADDVLIDHAWVWRADHGIEGFTAGAERRHRPLEHQHRPPRAWSSNGDRRHARPACSSSTTRSTTPIWNGERRPRRALPERAPLRPADPGRLDPARRHPRVGRLQGRRRRAAPPALRRRGLRLQPQRPVDHHRERLRGARTRRACGCTTC